MQNSKAGTSIKIPKVLIAGYEKNSKNYVEALSGTGIEPIVSLDLKSINRNMPDGLLLPGGSDIDPSLFHQKNTHSRIIDKELDYIQLSILDMFVKAHRPVLGICKGMQIINVYFKGDIIQHIPTASIHEYENGDKIHNSNISKASFLYSIYGDKAYINSAHHQAVGKTGIGLNIIQNSDDGVIEGLSHTSLPIIGLQWHPERMCFLNSRSDTADGRYIFKYFKKLLI